MKQLWARVASYNPRVVDGCIGAFVIITSLGNLIGTHLSDDHPEIRDVDAFAVILVLIGGGVLTFRRERPVQVLAVVSVVAYVFFAFGYAEGNNLDMAMVVAAATVVVMEPRWYRHASLSGLPFIPLSLFHASGAFFGRAASNLVTILIVCIVAHNIRLRRENREQVEITEQVTADKAVTDERLRIARELHDVVAHAMSVVTVQSGVAAHVIDSQPDEAKRMLENIRSTSHEALDEMRRLLGVLRGSADLAPAPTLLDIDELASSMRDSGVPVTVTVTGDRHDIPGGVDLTGYRIVQEALTNVLKHAGPASADVRVDYAPGLVVVEITDDGRGTTSVTSGGHGLLGMRERVSVFGGDLVSGPVPGGGYRVRATLPYAT